MWSTYRQSHLHLTDLLCRLYTLAGAGSAGGAHHRRALGKLRAEMEGWVDDICASIPYMLLGGNIPSSTPSAGGIWLLSHPPMLIGGLNLQWPLFTISILKNVDAGRRREMKRVLGWLGEALGVGQAGVLAQVGDS